MFVNLPAGGPAGLVAFAFPGGVGLAGPFGPFGFGVVAVQEVEGIF